MQASIGVLAWNPDRLARNMLEGGELIDMIDNDVIKDLKFVTHHFTKDANGKMLLGMAFVLSKQYSDDLSQKVTRGVRKSFAEGKSSVPKHGYIRDGDGYYRPDENNFALIKQAWRLRRAEKPLEAIAEYMNHKGYGRVVKKSGKVIKMDKRMLSDIFHDSFYYGLLVQANQTVDLRELYDFVPAVDEDMFMEIQQKFYQRSIPYQRKRHTFYPFKMMIHCSYCHLPMRTGASTGQTKRYLFFRCGTNGYPRLKKSIRAKVVLDYIYKLLEEGLNLTDEEYKEYYEEITAITEQNMQKLQQEIHNKRGILSQIEREIRERGLRLVERNYPETVRKVNEEKIAELDAQKDTLTDEIATLKEQLADPEKE